MTTRAARRPGPRVDLDVPAVLLSTAERLFAKHGIGEVSMRAVAREAGVAPAALYYHFATRTDLLTSLVRRRNETVGLLVHARLTELVEREEVPSARDLMAALIEPIAASVNADPGAGLDWLKIFACLAQSDDPVFHAEMSREPSVADQFVRATRRLLPDLDSSAARRRRVGLAAFSMLHAMAGADLKGYGNGISTGMLDSSWVEELIVFVSAGIAAD